MKTFIQLTVAVTLAATAAASGSHQHGHRHLHAKKDASKVEKREPDVVTKIVAGPTEIVYQLGDDILNAAEAEKGLDSGEYVVIGESTPTFTPPPEPTTTSTPTPTPTKDLGAQFIESQSHSTTTTTKTTPPPPPPPKTTSSPPPPPPSSTAKAPVANAAASTDNTSSTGNVNAEFPSGQIKCSEFPSQYGAVAAPWLGISDWLGVQHVPNYNPGSLISDIITAVTGQGCSPNSFCSYACQPGYQKSQWPVDSQGATGQSIGGLYCNADGYLELSRPDVKQLCIPGEGGVSVQNDLEEEVCACRTDYPGTEGMYIPTCPPPGQSLPLTNPSQTSYYKWQGKDTTAQYYINPKGVSAQNACIWTSPTDPTTRGNWAAVIAGVGEAADGTTFISLFLNKPTSDAQPDFNMEILGGNSKCGYENGQWFGGETGCTTGVAKGQKATIRYY